MHHMSESQQKDDGGLASPDALSNDLSFDRVLALGRCHMSWELWAFIRSGSREKDRGLRWKVH